MEVLTALRSADVDARVTPAPRGRVVPDAIVAVKAGSSTARFAVEMSARAPYPNELARFTEGHKWLREFGHATLVVPFVSQPLAELLTGANWSWADAEGNFDLRAPGLVLRQRRTAAAPKAKRRSLPHGSGALGIIRALIGFSENEQEDSSVTSLAAQAQVSQPRASQVLAQLQDLDLVTRMARRGWVPRREALLDRFLAEYRGPGGTERYLYSLSAPLDVAVRAARLHTERRPVAVSADVGADLLVSWRRPTVVVIYVSGDVSPHALDAVDAQGRHDANVIVRSPSDQSVFRSHKLVAGVQGVDVPLADETQLIWDLQDLGGADRLEAAGLVREWLLNRR